MADKRTPRERLIETAAALFYERGLPNVGINEVTDRAAVARMTLYNNFASKEALSLAAFERLAELRREVIEKHLAKAQMAMARSAKARSPARRADALFDAAERFASDPKFKGCAFINLAAQEANPRGPLHALVRSHKDWVRGIFRTIATEAGAAQPDMVAHQLMALWDGAVVEAYIQQSLKPIEAARRAVAVILGAKP